MIVATPNRYLIHFVTLTLNYLIKLKLHKFLLMDQPNSLLVNFEVNFPLDVFSFFNLDYIASFNLSKDFHVLLLVSLFPEISITRNFDNSVEGIHRISIIAQFSNDGYSLTDHSLEMASECSVICLFLGAHSVQIIL